MRYWVAQPLDGCYSSKFLRSSARRFLLEILVRSSARRTSPLTIVKLIHDVNPSHLSGASHRSSEVSLREALLDARRDTVMHRATMVKQPLDRRDALLGLDHC